MPRSLEIMHEACQGFTMDVRKMFGGHGFFAPNGGMFAGIVTDDEIVLKLERGPLREELIALGGHPWIYEGKDKPTTMQEWIVIPEDFYDDLDQLTSWLRSAHAAAPAKKPKAPKPAKATKVVLATGRTKLKTKTTTPAAKPAAAKPAAAKPKVPAARPTKKATKVAKSAAKRATRG